MMDVMKLVDKVQDRIEELEKQRKKLDPESYLWMEKGSIICELRDVVIEICEWALEEITGKKV